MSYDIRLRDPVTKETIELDHPHFMRGGTYAMDGTREAWLNVTYNYANWYLKEGVFPSFPDDRFHNGREGIRSIYGMTGADSIPVLNHAIAMLEGMEDDMTEEEIQEDAKKCGGMYWVSTRENAIKPLYQLLALAQMRPDGVWDGD